MKIILLLILLLPIFKNHQIHKNLIGIWKSPNWKSSKDSNERAFYMRFIDSTHFFMGLDSTSHDTLLLSAQKQIISLYQVDFSKDIMPIKFDSYMEYSPDNHRISHGLIQFINENTIKFEILPLTDSSKTFREGRSILFVRQISN